MFKKILVPVDIDYPRAAAMVYQKAVKLAEPGDAEIRLISVMPGFGMPIVAQYISDEVRKEAKNRFKAALEQFIEENCKEPVSYILKSGKNWQEIVKASEKWGADLIVVYHNRRRDINEVFSNSCSQKVMESADCSVLRLRNIRE